MANYETFKRALSHLDGAQWRLFEQLAQSFLSDEYPSLRPLASMSGDDGLDGGMFAVEDDPSVAVQYSVRKDWAAKIRQTRDRLRETTPSVRVLIYVTNQDIGTSGTALKLELRQHSGLFLDIRDREWLLANRNAGSRAAAEADEFCTRLEGVDSDVTDIASQAQALDDLESKAAFVYLNLQWQDDTREKGLSKLCFEAVVRAILRDTTSDARMTRDEVITQARKLLPAHHLDSLRSQVNGALARLAKVYIRHWAKLDEFCLTWEERKRLADRLVEMSLLDGALTRALTRVITTTSAEAGYDLRDEEIPEVVGRARSVLERVLLDRGEVFASAVAREKGDFVRFEDVEAVVYRDVTMRTPNRDFEPRLVAGAVQSLLIAPDDDARVYLRGLADTYTLFAFLRETPDVQSAIVKIFADGDFWLDTSVVLPLLAEHLLDESGRSHTHLLQAAAESGLRLFVTPGVLEEVATHVNRSRAYERAISSDRGAFGSPPFLLSSYKTAGSPGGDFDRWSENFCGFARLEDDMAEYLFEVHRIDVRDLTGEAGRAEDSLKFAVNEIWQEARDARDKRAERLGVPPMDVATRNRLIQHDVENYVGIVVRRRERNERRAVFGYKSWWLTMDGTAFRVHRELKQRINDNPPASPAISPDFMVHYLAIGPARARLSRRTEEALPLMMNMQVLDAVPSELLDLADELRRELADLPPHVVSRKIRDTLDEARQLIGPAAKAGEAGLTREIHDRLVAQAKQR